MDRKGVNKLTVILIILLIIVAVGAVIFSVKPDLFKGLMAKNLACSGRTDLVIDSLIIKPSDIPAVGQSKNTYEITATVKNQGGDMKTPVKFLFPNIYTPQLTMNQQIGAQTVSSTLFTDSTTIALKCGESKRFRFTTTLDKKDFGGNGEIRVAYDGNLGENLKNNTAGYSMKNRTLLLDISENILSAYQSPMIKVFLPDYYTPMAIAEKLKVYTATLDFSTVKKYFYGPFQRNIFGTIVNYYTAEVSLYPSDITALSGATWSNIDLFKGPSLLDGKGMPYAFGVNADPKSLTGLVFVINEEASQPNMKSLKTVNYSNIIYFPPEPAIKKN